MKTIPQQLLAAGFEKVSPTLYRAGKAADAKLVEIKAGKITAAYTALDKDLAPSRQSQILGVVSGPQGSLMLIEKRGERYWLSEDGQVVPEIARDLKTDPVRAPSGNKSWQAALMPQKLKGIDQKTDAEIEAMDSINGYSLESLEKTMAPGKSEEHRTGSSSQSGFLRKGQKLKPVLLKDNATVRDAGLTHQQLAEPLIAFRNAMVFLKHDHSRGKGRTLDQSYSRAILMWNGRQIEVKGGSTKGSQLSPFRDGTEGRMNFTLRDIETGKTLRVSELGIEMIRRYGFYQGDVPYRVEPAEVIEMFFSK